MRYKKIGEERIPTIGQGAMGIGGYLEMDNSQDDFYISILKHCITCGIKLFDTAEVYGKGHSEYLIGKAVEGIRDNIFISSKVAAENLRYDDVLAAADESLKRLNTDHVDLYMVHWPNANISISETMSAMSKLKRDGKIRYIGVSNFSLEELKEAQDSCDYRIDAIQLEYNLFERSVEHEMLEYCDDNHIVMIAYSPLDHGVLCSSVKKQRILQTIADKYEMTNAQLILNWLVSHRSVIVIPTSKNLQHITENSVAADFFVSADDLHKISRIFKRERVYVYPEKIKAEDGGRGDRKVYKTIEEAIENKMGMTPSPVELAEMIRVNGKANPVKVKAIDDKTGMYDYVLVEGRLRYWAWTIAFNWKQPLLVNIVE